jgi:hypothetical protein
MIFRFVNFLRVHSRDSRPSLFVIRHSDFVIVMIRVHSWLQDQHAIAVAVELIAFANCFLIGAKQELAAGKCAYEHEQS